MKTILRMVVKDSGTKEVCDAPSKAFKLLEDIQNQDREHFMVLLLDARSNVIGKQIVSIGTLNASLVHPREVFKPAILMNAATIIIAHNHPSGDENPSSEDRDTTRRLINAGVVLGIGVQDHIIVAGKNFFSFKEQGLL